MKKTNADGISDKNKDNSGINNERQDVFSKWVTDEVTKIVKKKIFEGDFYQEKFVIEVKVKGDKGGAFSIVIDRENDDYSNRVQVIMEKIDYDICIEGDCNAILQFLNKKIVLEDEVKQKRLVVTTKGEDNNKLIEQISYIFAPFIKKRRRDCVSFGKFVKGLFVHNSNDPKIKFGERVKKILGIICNIAFYGLWLVVGIWLILKSVEYACINQSPVYAITKTEDNETLNIGYFQYGGSDDLIDLDNGFIEQLKIVGTVSLADEDSTFDVRSNMTDKDKLFSLALAFGGYALIVWWIFCVYQEKPKETDKSGFRIKFLRRINRVSGKNFFIFVLLLPIVIITISALVSTDNFVRVFDFGLNITAEIVFHIFGIAQCLCLALWFGFHLWPRRNRIISSKTCKKLDLYSTIAVVVLTFIWVVYDISYIKIYFAIILVEFMFVQVRIKMIEMGNG